MATAAQNASGGDRVIFYLHDLLDVSRGLKVIRQMHDVDESDIYYGGCHGVLGKLAKRAGLETQLERMTVRAVKRIHGISLRKLPCPDLVENYAYRYKQSWEDI